jgi:hypothetical protein
MKFGSEKVRLLFLSLLGHLSISIWLAVARSFSYQFDFLLFFKVIFKSEVAYAFKKY